MSCDFAFLGLAEAAELIRDKKLSPVEYATALLARIERQDPQTQRFHRVDAGASTRCGARGRG
jgi:Asp-tRNA(Asn)/Glu-tRNA(Gln) amidotransferase A subunit family amidase